MKNKQKFSHEVLPFVGETIQLIYVNSNSFVIRLNNYSRININTEGDCCSYTIMIVQGIDNDNFECYKDAQYLGYEVKKIHHKEINELSYSNLDILFLVIKTSIGDIDICWHNKHTGYYTLTDFNVSYSFRTKELKN
jgi:hypothetical protein